MDNQALRDFEDQVSTAAQAAFGLASDGFDDGHGGMLGATLETMGSLVDHLARVAQALPGSRGYAAEKAAVITRCAIGLQAKIVMPDMMCGRYYLSEPVVDVDGDEFRYDEACELVLGHAGDCGPNVFRTATICHAEDVAVHAAQLAATVYRALSDGWDDVTPAEVRAQITQIRMDLDLIDKNLRYADEAEIVS